MTLFQLRHRHNFGNDTDVHAGDGFRSFEDGRRDRAYAWPVLLIVERVAAGSHLCEARLEATDILGLANRLAEGDERSAAFVIRQEGEIGAPDRGSHGREARADLPIDAEPAGLTACLQDNDGISIEDADVGGPARRFLDLREDRPEKCDEAPPLV